MKMILGFSAARPTMLAANQLRPTKMPIQTRKEFMILPSIERERPASLRSPSHEHNPVTTIAHYRCVGSVRQVSRPTSEWWRRFGGGCAGFDGNIEPTADGN